MVTENDVIEALHGVEDPELGMDIVEIGLFYEAQIDGPSVKIIHSLTSIGCPAGQIRTGCSTKCTARRTTSCNGRNI